MNYDFLEMSKHVVFPATTGPEGDTQFVPISVTLIDDFIAENNETFFLSLSNPVNGQIIDGWYDTAIVNILDDDGEFLILFVLFIVLVLVLLHSKQKSVYKSLKIFEHFNVFMKYFFLTYITIFGFFFFRNQVTIICILIIVFSIF